MPRQATRAHRRTRDEMAEPSSRVRWQAAPRSGAGPSLLTAVLGLVALTGCTWTVIAGHAWLSLLSGCSHWLVARGRQPREAATPSPPPPAQPPPATEARAAPPVLHTPAPAAHAAASMAGALPHPAEQHAWPEPLQFGGATCAGVFVYAVTLNESAPRRSAVSLATSSSARGRYVRPGQQVEGWELLGITDDWTGANPVVWLARDEEVCRARLTGNPDRVRAVQLEARQREAQLRKEAQQRREERRRRRRRAQRRR